MTRDEEFDHRLKTYREIVKAYEDQVDLAEQQEKIFEARHDLAVESLEHKRAQLAILQTILKLMEAINDSEPLDEVHHV